MVCRRRVSTVEHRSGGLTAAVWERCGVRGAAQRSCVAGRSGARRSGVVRKRSSCVAAWRVRVARGGAVWASAWRQSAAPERSCHMSAAVDDFEESESSDDSVETTSAAKVDPKVALFKRSCFAPHVQVLHSFH